jgi:hypothetical protein
MLCTILYVMPHHYLFNPCTQKGRKGSPILRLNLHDPQLERTLETTRMDSGSLAPYRVNPEVENVVDQLTLGIQPKRMDDGLLMLMAGMNKGEEGPLALRLAPQHIHQTEEQMRPPVLVEHSKAETGSVISITAMEELSILASAVMRKLGFSSYLSTVETVDGTKLSALTLFDEGNVVSFTIMGQHPAISSLTIFEDPEALGILSLLRAVNGVKKLHLEIKSGKARESESQERYLALVKDMAIGSASGHHLSGMVEAVLLSLIECYPGLLSIQKELN